MIVFIVHINFNKYIMKISIKSFTRPWAVLPLFFFAASALAADPEVRPLDAAIKKIDSDSSFNIKIQYGSTPKLVLSGDNVQFERIKIEQQGDTLSISHRSISWLSPAKINIDITMPQLQEVKFHGSGSGIVEGFSGDQFKLGLHSSGSVVLDVQYQNPTLELRGSGSLTGSLHDMKTLQHTQSGSGSANLNGKAESVELKLSGSGSLEATKLIASSLNAKVSGSGSIKAFAKDSAEVATSGSGSAHIYGAPEKQRSKSTGSGKAIFH